MTDKPETDPIDIWIMRDAAIATYHVELTGSIPAGAQPGAEIALTLKGE